jgi:hypothetical protein
MWIIWRLSHASRQCQPTICIRLAQYDVQLSKWVNADVLDGAELSCSHLHTVVLLPVNSASLRRSEHAWTRVPTRQLPGARAPTEHPWIYLTFLLAFKLCPHNYLIINMNICRYSFGPLKVVYEMFIFFHNTLHKAASAFLARGGVGWVQSGQFHFWARSFLEFKSGTG